jgi:hypothetical protein
MQLIHNFCIWPKIQQKTPDKNPWQQSAYANKNLLKIPCGQKSAWIKQKSFVKTLT